MNDAVAQWISSTGPWAPLLSIVLFLAGSLLMIWRLESMSARGLEGTVLGTLIMPYCSGLGNLIFAYVLGKTGGNSREVMTNSLVNNVTNMTLLIGLPAVIWGLSLLPLKSTKLHKRKKTAADPHRLNRLSLLLTVTAAAFFTGVLWALARDGTIDFGDGLVLVGVFLFWQTFHVFDVLKSNVRQNRSVRPILLLDFALLLLGAYEVYVSTDWLVTWVSSMRGGFIHEKHLGWLSGWLMVLPNALLAFYYAWQARPEVVYSSQVGDGHICIPLCIGVFALFRPIPIPDFFEMGIWLLLAAAVVHFLCVALFGSLPRFIGMLLIGAYAIFVYKGFAAK